MKILETGLLSALEGSFLVEVTVSYGIIFLLIVNLTEFLNMDVLSLGWGALLALFSWSIAMVIWARNGF